MLGQDDLLFVQFRLEAEAALLRIVHDFEAQGLTAAEAIEQATVECVRLLNAEQIGRQDCGRRSTSTASSTPIRRRSWRKAETGTGGG